jgi:hypothetical protein
MMVAGVEMPASVVSFERFRQEREQEREQKTEDENRLPDVAFLRRPGVALTTREVAHRRAMLVNLGSKQ